VAVVFGGVSINPQMMRLRGGADVVVATPGRLLDLVEHNALRLGASEHLVLDEADRLLDLGFADELQARAALLPQQRQNLFFSATFPHAVQGWPAKPAARPRAHRDGRHARHPAPHRAARHRGGRPQAHPAAAPPGQEQNLVSVLVFVATQYAAEHVAEKLYKAGIYARRSTAGSARARAQQVLQEFKDERWQVVVTTDLAARGIDIAQLPAVVNYDLPRSPADYVHRIGRTGRAGRAAWP
jgi:ATP-dependent RNA helicase RhlE